MVFIEMGSNLYWTMLKWLHLMALGITLYMVFIDLEIVYEKLPREIL